MFVYVWAVCVFGVDVGVGVGVGVGVSVYIQTDGTNKLSAMRYMLSPWSVASPPEAPNSSTCCATNSRPRQREVTCPRESPMLLGDSLSFRCVPGTAVCTPAYIYHQMLHPHRRVNFMHVYHKKLNLSRQGERGCGHCWMHLCASKAMLCHPRRRTPCICIAAAVQPSGGRVSTLPLYIH